MREWLDPLVRQAPAERVGSGLSPAGLVTIELVEQTRGARLTGPNGAYRTLFIHTRRRVLITIPSGGRDA